MKVDGVIRALPNMDQGQRKTVRDRARQWAQSGTSQEQVDARRVLEALDALDYKESADIAKLPTAERIVEAFRKVPLTESERKVVEAVLDLPGRTSGELTAHLGWGGDSAWHLHFGAMCGRRGRLLGIGPAVDSSGQPFNSGLLCDYDDVTHGFTLKPEAVQAFALIGLTTKKTPA